MLTGQLRSQIDKIWDAFWSGGISNPLEVIEQITYLLFLRRLDDLETLEENKAARLGEPMARRFYPAGKDALGRAYEQLRWSHFKNEAPAEMFAIVRDSVFPFLRTLGADDSTYAHHMKDARFTIPTPALLAKVVDLLDDVPMSDRDTKGDLYEYMLGKIATAGQNGQFRTPRHIIALMVAMTAPQPTDIICDPACGTGGFLVAAGEHLRREFPNLLHDATLRKHFHEGLFHGFDFDNTCAMAWRSCAPLTPGSRGTGRAPARYLASRPFHRGHPHPDRRRLRGPLGVSPGPRRIERRIRRGGSLMTAPRPTSSQRRGPKRDPVAHRRIGARVAMIRQYVGLSQAQVARLTGTSQTHVACVEKGYTRLRFTEAALLAELFGVPLNSFDPDRAWTREGGRAVTAW